VPTPEQMESVKAADLTRRLLPVVVLLLLSSCTPVDDFGAYWDKGFVDPALEGTWKKIGIPGQDLNATPGADRLLFTKDGPSYSWQAINPLDSTLSDDAAAQRRKDNDARLALRTLKIGNHLFFAARGPQGNRGGMLNRYEVQGDLLLEDFINNGTAVDFLEAKHPTARNIHKNKAEGRYVVIETFDDEVFQILSEISDDAAYWDLQCQYRKVP
jgi:hypothetical protein